MNLTDIMLFGEAIIGGGGSGGSGGGAWYMKDKVPDEELLHGMLYKLTDRTFTADELADCFVALQSDYLGTVFFEVEQENVVSDDGATMMFNGNVVMIMSMCNGAGEIEGIPDGTYLAVNFEEYTQLYNNFAFIWA